MKLRLTRWAILPVSLLLLSCSGYFPFESDYPSPPPQRMAMQPGQVSEQAPGEPKLAAVRGGSIGGNLVKMMDSNDRQKMSESLDKALGKSTHWVNYRNNIQYTVTPIKKVTVEGSSFCRIYRVEAMQSKQRQEFSGTACVGTDGNWQPV